MYITHGLSGLSIQRASVRSRSKF